MPLLAAAYRARRTLRAAVMPLPRAVAVAVLLLARRGAAQGSSDSSDACDYSRFTRPGILTDNDRAVSTTVDTVAVDAVAGYTTYQLALELAVGAFNVYSLYGDDEWGMLFPPAFQVPAPFGATIGGADSALFAFNPDAEFDSWITIGKTGGDAGGEISSIGLDLNAWSEESPLECADRQGGAIFFMDPDAAPTERTCVVAQQLQSGGPFEPKF